MANASITFAPFDFNEIQGNYNSLKGHKYNREEAAGKGKSYDFSGMEDWGGIGSLFSEYGLYQVNTADKGVYFSKYEQQTQPPPWHQQQQQQQFVSNYPVLGDFDFNASLPSAQHVQDTSNPESIQTAIPFLAETKESQSIASLDHVGNIAGGFNCLIGDNLSNIGNEMGKRKLSTEELVRLAGERYIQLSTQRIDDIYMLMHPYGSAYSGLSMEETQDVELAHLLLAAAEKVGYQQFERASRLLSHCEGLASDTGNPVHRVVYYFAEALHERIDRETGRFTSRRMWRRGKYDTNDMKLSSNLTFLAVHQGLPFSQVMQFAGVQAIIENIGSKTKVHLVDFNVGSGVHLTVLMQALAGNNEYQRIKQLKITAIGTTDKQKIEETGKSLLSFAESLNLPFSFKVVFLSDMKDIKEGQIEIKPEEAVVVYFKTILRSMISRPYCLETTMRVITRLNPSIIVVSEVEANHNSPSFVNRFIEALFFYSAFFDCLEDCMHRDNQHRMTVEGIVFRDGIHNIVATEGEERVTRSVKIEVWRAFFARFGIEEAALSESSLYQANLVVQQFACGNSCTLEMNGKSLIVGWKGTPIHSLSTWKLH